MAADGMAYGNRITHFNTSKAAATVVDAILNSTYFASRMLYNGKNFDKATLKKTVKIVRRSQGQWVSGLESLNSSAENVTIQMEFNQTLYTSPVVDILAEAFAREQDQDIDYNAFNKEDALDEVTQDLSSAFYGTGSAKMPLGLEAIVDDGTNVSTIGGQSKSTYPTLAGTVTASGGNLSLSKMATLHSTVSDTGPKEMPTMFDTTFTIFDLYESLLTPTLRHEYQVLPMGGKYPVASDKVLSMGAGFNVHTYRGIPMLRDKACTSGVLYLLNENYLQWFGRTVVPAEFRDFLKPVRLGKSVKEGQASERPSDYHGFFYQEKQMMPNQGGIISRFWVVGQMVSFQPRRQGKLTGITGV
jgi:hypothetical protein